MAAFGAIIAVFAYTLVANVIERPDGIKIASFFIAGIVIVSLISRVLRSTELRCSGLNSMRQADRFIAEASRVEIRIIANQLDAGDAREYFLKEKEVREDTHLPADEPVSSSRSRCATPRSSRTS